MLHLLYKFWRDHKAAAAVEMAWVGMFMGLMTLPFIDLADVTFTSMKLAAALNSSILYALKNPTDTAGMSTVVQRVSNFDASKLTVNAENFCECNGSEADCNSTCDAGIEKFMTINASFSRPLMFSYPGIDNPYLLSRQRTVRVQ
ncbi:MAG: hypothetical protein HY053_02495 [Proteobacteria bacterium]|nr:hypothetical protein [Pseudomonadota bacterium]